MKELIELQKKIVPEISDIIEKRYSILLAIKYNQPIGRRSLSSIMGQSERWIRSELDILKKQNLINIMPSGMIITEEGKETVEQLSTYIENLKGLDMLSQKLTALLGVKKAIVVSGDCEKRPEVLHEMGKRAFNYIKGCIKDNSVIAVTGGTSTMAVADNAKIIDKNDVTVVPATGGHSGNLKTQANAVAEKLAMKLKANYYPLYLPENINDEMLNTMLADSNTAKVVKLISKADIFLFGLSTIDQIAKKRKLEEKFKNYLKEKGAMAEAFGYYFNDEGTVVHKRGSIGISIKEYGDIKTVICIAGGLSKAEAIISINKGKDKNILVMDEKAGKQIYNIMRGE